ASDARKDRDHLVVGGNPDVADGKSLVSDADATLRAQCFDKAAVRHEFVLLGQVDEQVDAAVKEPLKLRARRCDIGCPRVLTRQEAAFDDPVRIRSGNGHRHIVPHCKYYTLVIISSSPDHSRMTGPEVRTARKLRGWTQ